MRKFIVSLIITLVGMIGTTSFAATTHTQSYSEHDFEQAVQLIKKYETLHTPTNWPLIGYGHKVMPGEKYARGQKLTESQADALLRKDLKKFVDLYKNYGKDSLLLGVLAYNVGPGRVNKSNVVRLLKNGNRNIREAFEAMCRYKGKVHKQIRARRIEEFQTLFKH
ncbi:MAG: lysozyme [Bacteroides sp.]|nr:lysozyme [Bacteroides sp.]